MTTYYTTLESPIGPLLLTSNGKALTGMYMNEHKGAPGLASEWVRDDHAAPFDEARHQLDAYFAGSLTRFELPLAAEGTDFQKRVWQALSEIPYGETVSYGELARTVGNPNASRAVGMANGRNPISIIVPCHRVVGTKGLLTGYAGGLERKEKLLRHERTVTTQRNAH